MSVRWRARGRRGCGASYPSPSRVSRPMPSRQGTANAPWRPPRRRCASRLGVPTLLLGHAFDRAMLESEMWRIRAEVHGGSGRPDAARAAAWSAWREATGADDLRRSLAGLVLARWGGVDGARAVLDGIGESEIRGRLAIALRARAIAIRRMGDPAATYRAYQTLLEHLESSRVLTAGSARERRMWFEGQVEGYLELVEFLIADGRFEEALAVAERTKARHCAPEDRGGRAYERWRRYGRDGLSAPGRWRSDHGGEPVAT
jgi:hypothetical protein